MRIEIPDETLVLHSERFGKHQDWQLRRKTVEECAELIVAIQHHADDKVSLDSVSEECADVIICAAFLLHSFPPEHVDIIQSKLDRLHRVLGNMETLESKESPDA